MERTTAQQGENCSQKPVCKGQENNSASWKGTVTVAGGGAYSCRWERLHGRVGRGQRGHLATVTGGFQVWWQEGCSVLCAERQGRLLRMKGVRQGHTSEKSQKGAEVASGETGVGRRAFQASLRAQLRLENSVFSWNIQQRGSLAGEKETGE